MKKFTCFSAFVAITSLATAQTIDDALRFSQTNTIGTARYSSMGGAFGALGGDISVASTNPAGLAVFRRSELTITPILLNTGTMATYQGNRNDDSRFNIALGNIGIVGTNIINNEGGGWVSTTFAFGYNRTNNLHRRTHISGNNYYSSLLDVFLDQANSRGGLPPEQLDPFGAGLAFNTNLIYDVDTFANSYRYTSDIPWAGREGVIQKNSISSSGGMGETVFSFSGNYDNRLYLGATVGYSSLRYSQYSNYYEEALPDTNHILESFTLNQDFSTRGSGFNIKAGILFRALDWLRLGAAIHSPTFYSMTDNYGSTMSSRFKSGYALYDATESATGNISYSLTTPMRAIGSVAFVIGKQGLISADYEFIDYSAARLNSSSNKEYWMVQNAQIRDNLTGTQNIRIGAEWRIDPFAIRAGYANTGNPYRESINEGSTDNYSIGLGIREEGYFFDFAYVFSQQKNHSYFIYDPAFVPPTTIDWNRSMIMATLGFRF